MAETFPIAMPLEQEGSKSVVRAWLKKVGEFVKRDEPIVELETDKVAVEVPAPCDGVLAQIALGEGDEAAPGAVLGFVSIETQARSDRRSPASSAAQPSTPTKQEAKMPAESRRSEQRLSPLVKRLVNEHRLDVTAIAGTGRDGRITHKDVEAFLSSPAYGGRGGERSEAAMVGATLAAPSGRFATTAPAGGGRNKIPHTAMRRAIAEHMARSVATAPHVTAVFEADFSAVAAHRTKHRDAYAKAGAQLTFSAYVVRAAAEAMQVSPNVNARWHDDFLEVFEDVNIGMGVALGDKGLIVPVIHRAQTLPLKQTAQALTDLTERARSNRLKPADVQGGTFTISNHGVSGSLVAAPIIINQPQSAILGVGKLEKRVVVREVAGADAMVIKPMAYVSLTVDHRVLDGHQTNAWLTRFVEILETWPLESA